MRNKLVGTLFVVLTAVCSYRFASGWEQMASLVLLWSVAAFMHIRAVQYLPTIRFSLAIIVVIPLIALHGMGWAVASTVIMGCFHAVVFGQRWTTLFTSSFNYGSSAMLAGLTFQLLGGQVGRLPVPQSLWPLTVSAIVYAGANMLLTATFVAVQDGIDWGSLVKSMVRASWLNYLAVTYVGTVLAVFSSAMGLFGLLMFSGLLVAIMELLQINTTMHYERNQRLQAQAELAIDPKTRVYNFRYLHDWLSHDCQRPTSLLFIDIDDFKQLNDRYGHETGDDVLCTVAGIINSTVRSRDSVVRFGGEEFVVIIPDTDGAGALAMAERVRGAISQSQLLDIAVTVSIGVASLADADDKHDLLLLADRAMYQAKTLGKDRCCLWDPGKQLGDASAG